MNIDPCPFEEGDRVDHKLFGLGTVSGTPVTMVGPDMESADGVSHAGWRVPVHWDDERWTAESVAHHVLTKVSSPDVHPFSYWDCQWQPLLRTWLEARRKVEEICSSFRPVPDQGALANAQELEREAFEAMQRFWEQEQAGQHS